MTPATLFGLLLVALGTLYLGRLIRLPVHEPMNRSNLLAQSKTIFFLRKPKPSLGRSLTYVFLAVIVIRLVFALPAVFENASATLRDREEHAGVGR